MLPIYRVIRRNTLYPILYPTVAARVITARYFISRQMDTVA